MEKGDFKIFGCDFTTINDYWIRVYSNTLLVMHSLTNEDVSKLSLASEVEFEDSFIEALKLLQEKYNSINGHIEGYSLIKATAFIISYCKHLVEKDATILIDYKKKEIEKLEAKIRELKAEIK